ncbi:MAG TPA: cation diffusion facilitator family transporter [Candidatus Baltobacteraceae bacterium]
MDSRRRLVVALVLIAAVAAFEFWGGARAGSLALLTDAVHVCMDAFALGVALFAAIGASRPADARKSFGYGRVEILGALANGTLLLAATIVIVYEALQRFGHPFLPQGGLMSGVAAIGLVVNLGVGLLLLRDGKSDLNVRTALFHVAGDAVGAIAVIVGGAFVLATRALWIDPLLSLLVAAIIVAGVWRVLRDAADVLLESVPRDVDPAAVAADIARIAGVTGVHDLHVWSIGSRARALCAHVDLDDRRISESDAILQSIEACLRADYAIDHITIQFECQRCDTKTCVMRAS